jgi:hypothetical protein
MKNLLFLVILSFIGSGLIAQQGAGYVIQNPVLKIIATKNGEDFQWENKNISVALAYQTGQFAIKLSNDDFVLNKTDQPAISDTIEDNREFTISGIFPIDQIIDQLPNNQQYVVELQLSNWDLSIDQTLNFNLNVTNPGTNQAQYRMFQMTGKLYNDELQLPAFDGFDNEVEIWILFNGFKNVN